MPSMLALHRPGRRSLLLRERASSTARGASIAVAFELAKPTPKFQFNKQHHDSFSSCELMPSTSSAMSPSKPTIKPRAQFTKRTWFLPPRDRRPLKSVKFWRRRPKAKILLDFVRLRDLILPFAEPPQVTKLKANASGQALPYHCYSLLVHRPTPLTFCDESNFIIFAGRENYANNSSACPSLPTPLGSRTTCGCAISIARAAKDRVPSHHQFS